MYIIEKPTKGPNGKEYTSYYESYVLGIVPIWSMSKKYAKEFKTKTEAAAMVKKLKAGRRIKINVVPA